jgi:NAD+ kinase
MPDDRASRPRRADKSAASDRLAPQDGARRPRVGLVTKRSAWTIHIDERKDPKLRRLVAEKDETISPLRASHDAHQRTVLEVTSALAAASADIVFACHAGDSFDATGLDLVVTVGGDGTLLSASHYVDDVPVLAINSAPSHSVGFFCGAKSGGADKAIAAAMRGALRRTVLTRMKVTLNGQVVAARVLNEALFCHASPAATSRYIVHFDGIEEQQKSSGFWIGPAAGSTAAQRSAGGRVLPLTSKQLQLVVREPYTPHRERYRLCCPLIPPGEPVVVRSKMHEARIFIDGPDTVIPVGFGDAIEFTQAPQSLTVLGIASRRKWG